MRRVGESRTERFDIIPAQFRVMMTIARRMFAEDAGETIDKIPVERAIRLIGCARRDPAEAVRQHLAPRARSRLWHSLTHCAMSGAAVMFRRRDRRVCIGRSGASAPSTVLSICMYPSFYTAIAFSNV